MALAVGSITYREGARRRLYPSQPRFEHGEGRLRPLRPISLFATRGRIRDYILVLITRVVVLVFHKLRPT